MGIKISYHFNIDLEKVFEASSKQKNCLRYSSISKNPALKKKYISIDPLETSQKTSKKQLSG